MAAVLCFFSEELWKLNPDLTFLDEVIRLYERTAQIWNNDNGNDLEALGGGFNVTLQNLQDESRRVRIAAKIKGGCRVYGQSPFHTG